MTRLKVYHAVPRDILGILTMCTQVVELHMALYFDKTNEDYPEPTTVVDLPHLQFLLVDFLEEHDTETFFVCPRAPELRTLSLPGPRDESHLESLPTSLRPLISRSERLPSLHILYLAYEQARVHVLSDGLFTRPINSVGKKSADTFLLSFTTLLFYVPRTFSSR